MRKSDKTSPEFSNDDAEFLNELRPHRFDEFVGQDKIKNNLNISIQNPLIEITWDGKSANVQGEIILNSPSLTSKRVWILAISFNQDGAVVGFRRWESTTTLSSGDVMPFELTVSALDSEIDRIELIAEGIKN